MSDTGQEMAAGTADMPPHKAERVPDSHTIPGRMEPMGAPGQEERGLGALEEATGHHTLRPWTCSEATKTSMAEEERVAFQDGGHLPEPRHERPVRESQTDAPTSSAAVDGPGLRG